MDNTEISEWNNTTGISESSGLGDSLCQFMLGRNAPIYVICYGNNAERIRRKGKNPGN